MTKSVKPLVFLSYHRSEVAYAVQLRDALRSIGFDVWWDQSVQGGEGWNELIEEKLRESDCVVVLWSRRACQSDWVKHEASVATTSEVYVPCRIEETNLPEPIARLQALSLVGWDGSSGTAEFPKLVGAIEKVTDYEADKTILTTRFVPWPRSVPRSLSELLIQDSQQILFSLIAVFAVTVSLWTFSIVREQKTVIDRADQRLLQIQKQVDAIEQSVKRNA